MLDRLSMSTVGRKFTEGPTSREVVLYLIVLLRCDHRVLHESQNSDEDRALSRPHTIALMLCLLLALDSYEDCEYRRDILDASAQRCASTSSARCLVVSLESLLAIDKSPETIVRVSKDGGAIGTAIETCGKRPPRQGS